MSVGVFLPSVIVFVRLLSCVCKLESASSTYFLEVACVFAVGTKGIGTLELNVLVPPTVWLPVNLTTSSSNAKFGMPVISDQSISTPVLLYLLSKLISVTRSEEHTSE